MKKKDLMVLIIIAGLSFPAIGFSQAVFPAGGGSASGSAGSVSYSIGQAIMADGSGSTGLVGSGFQQPYEKVIINGLNDDLSIDLLITTFPNPVSNILNLKSKGSESADMYYRLINSRGEILLNEKIISDEMDIQMKNYSPGVYFLNVYRNKVNVRSIKIIKN